MPAYKKQLYRRYCVWPHCIRTATQEVFDTRNASQGRYCARHATEALRTLRRQEQEQEPAQASNAPHHRREEP
jgi:hypothetical protein